MPPAIPVVLAAHDADWARQAALHAVALRREIGSVLVTVEPIGSTSVPGLIAKPIIDLMPLVGDLADLDGRRERVESLGYAWHGPFGIEGRRFCTLSDAAGARIVNAHFFEARSPDADRHLAFRDFLRAHPDVASAYADEKRRARDLHVDDSHAYADEKSAWIRETEARALAWVAIRRERESQNTRRDSKVTV